MGAYVARDRFELLFGACCEHDVGTGLGKGARTPGADPAARARDDGDPISQPESIEEHGTSLALVGDRRPIVGLNRRNLDGHADRRAGHEMTGAPETVLDAVHQLEAEGYGASFTLRPDGIYCSACKREHVADNAAVERVYRFEGPSDPDEEAVVYGLRCPVCGARGMLVSAYGPTADPDTADRLVMLDERFRAQEHQ
jgi:hypothetical protein